MAKKKKITRAQVKAYIIGLLSEQFGLPASYFDEGDSLGKDWFFTPHALVELGKAICKSPFAPVYVTPKEMAQRTTIKSLIDLVASKV